MEWYRKWFNEAYLDLYRQRNNQDALKQIELIERELEPDPSRPILDLCCGEGRHCHILHQKGYWIEGVDLSETLIASGKKKYPHLALRREDMRSFTGGYDVILSLFTSFGYFEKESDDLLVLKRVFAALPPGGRFWLDFFNAPYLKKYLVRRSLVKIEEDEFFVEKRRLERGRVLKEIEHRSPRGIATYLESVRWYTRDDLVGLLDRAGFDLVTIYGGYTGEKWSEDSPRTILSSRKRVQ